MNINPRSNYNKDEYFCLLLDMFESDVIFISDSWDWRDHPLDEVIKKEHFQIIKNNFQRDFKGGKPALFLNEEKHFVKPLCPEPLTVPIEVESYNYLMAKYGSKLNFIISGDTNRLNLSPILKQSVQTPNKLNPDAILDCIITTLLDFYQVPVTKPPIQNDAENLENIQTTW